MSMLRGGLINIATAGGAGGGGGAGVTLLEGLSGIIDLDSPDNSIFISTAGQVIRLTTLKPVDARQASGSIIPDINCLYALGTANRRWAILHACSGHLDRLLVGIDAISDPIVTLEASGEGRITNSTGNADFRLSAGRPQDEPCYYWSFNNGTGDRGALCMNHDGVLKFFNKKPSESFIQRFTITSGTGFVGIGADATIPRCLLDVSGLICGSGAQFLQRPTVVGTNVALITDFVQTSIEGLSGVIDLDSPDGSIRINTVGQVIQLTTSNSGFAPSGASFILRQYDDNGHLPKARILSTVSGVRLQDQGARSISGLVVSLDFDNTPQGIEEQELTWNGFRLQWVQRVRKTTRTFTPQSGLEFVLQHGLNSTDWSWSMWRTDSTPIEVLIPDNLYPSGVNHAIVVFKSSASAPSGYTGKVVFIG